MDINNKKINDITVQPRTPGQADITESLIGSIRCGPEQRIETEIELFPIRTPELPSDCPIFGLPEAPKRKFPELPIDCPILGLPEDPKKLPDDYRFFVFGFPEAPKEKFSAPTNSENDPGCFIGLPPPIEKLRPTPGQLNPIDCVVIGPPKVELPPIIRLKPTLVPTQPIDGPIVGPPPIFRLPIIDRLSLNSSLVDLLGLQAFVDPSLSSGPLDDVNKDDPYAQDSQKLVLIKPPKPKKV